MADHRNIKWQAHEYFHQEKSGDWYWGLGIVAITFAVLAIIFTNTLFALVIVLFAFAAAMQAHREPRLIDFELTPRGVVIDHILYPYTTLESFSMADQHLHKPDPKALIKSKKLFMPFLHMPIEQVDDEDVRNYLLQHIHEEELHESFLEKILEYFGF
jgi:hypothetical protein